MTAFVPGGGAYPQREVPPRARRGAVEDIGVLLMSRVEIKKAAPVGRRFVCVMPLFKNGLHTAEGTGDTVPVGEAF